MSRHDGKIKGPRLTTAGRDTGKPSRSGVDAFGDKRPRCPRQYVGKLKAHVSGTVCAIQWHKERDQALYYVIVAFILCFLLPGVVLAICYIKILKEVKKSSKVHPAPELSQSEGSTHPKKNYSTSSKAVRSLLIIVCAYFICMTPFSVTKLVKVVTDDEMFLTGGLNTAASIVEFCSSAINPLIYGIFRRDFRKAYQQLLFKAGILRSYTTEHSNLVIRYSADSIS